jgi:hypothetical protein
MTKEEAKKLREEASKRKHIREGEWVIAKTNVLVI